jgi:hypothetical protein
VAGAATAVPQYCCTAHVAPVVAAQPAGHLNTSFWRQQAASSCPRVWEAGVGPVAAQHPLLPAGMQPSWGGLFGGGAVYLLTLFDSGVWPWGQRGVERLTFKSTPGWSKEVEMPRTHECEQHTIVCGLQCCQLDKLPLPHVALASASGLDFCCIL